MYSFIDRTRRERPEWVTVSFICKLGFDGWWLRGRLRPGKAQNRMGSGGSELGVFRASEKIWFLWPKRRYWALVQGGGG